MLKFLEYIKNLFFIGLSGLAFESINEKMIEIIRLLKYKKKLLLFIASLWSRKNFDL